MMKIKALVFGTLAVLLGGIALFMFVPKTTKMLPVGLTSNFNITVTASSLTTAFDCSAGFASSGTCGVQNWNVGGSNNFKLFGSTGNGIGASVSGSQVLLLPAGGSHLAMNLDWQTKKVNVGQFSTTFTFIPNGANMVAFILQNDTFGGSTCLGPNASFSCGATDEGGFTQVYQPATSPPNNVFAVSISQTNGFTAGSDTFTYSSVQYCSVQGLTNSASMHQQTVRVCIRPMERPALLALGLLAGVTLA